MNDKTRMIRWDERYAGEDYLFGTEPNDFLVEIAGHAAVVQLLARSGCEYGRFVT